MVMCKQPATRAPFSGWLAPYSALKAIKPGISASANLISFLPHSARLISATLCLRLKSMDDFVTVDIYLLIFNVRQSYNSPFRNAILSIAELQVIKEISTDVRFLSLNSCQNQETK